MKLSLRRWVALLNIGLVLLTGCHPTQPFFVAEDGDLSHYLHTATQIEYPDLEIDSLPEAAQSMAPYTAGNDNYQPWDLVLEDCINITLQNSKLARTVPGSQLQSGNNSLVVLSSPSQQLRTVYDPAITSSTTNPQAIIVDQNGNRTLARGAARANQVGGVEDALSEFDAQYSSFLAYNTTDRPRNTGANVFTPNFFTARDTTYQSALSKRLGTGGVATARMQTIYSANNVPAPSQARAVESDFTQILELQFQHPLMRGRGTLVNRIPVVLARINEDQALSQFEESIRNLVRDVEVAYWDLYCAYWVFETSKSARDASLNVWRVANDKLKAGQGQSAAEAQALSQVHQFSAQVVASLNGSTIPGGDPGIKGRERALRYIMGLAPTDGRLIRPIDKPTIAHTEFDWPSVHAELLNRNLDLRISRFQVKSRELELISAKNQVLPEVNLTGQYRWVGVGDEWFGSNGGPSFPLGRTSAWEGVTGGDFQEVGARFEVTPNAFGSRRALATVTNAKLQLARETELLREKELAAVHELTDSLIRLDSHYSQMMERLNQLAAVEREVKVQEDRYRTGDVNLDQILDGLLRAQERQARAQQDYYRTVCEYNKNLVQIHLLKGSLLEYNAICLEEGPWPDKAYWDATERARERDAARHLPYGASRPSVISRGPVVQNQGTANANTTAPANLANQPSPDYLSPPKPSAKEWEDNGADSKNLKPTPLSKEPGNGKPKVQPETIPAEPTKDQPLPGITPKSILQPTPSARSGPTDSVQWSTRASSGTRISDRITDPHSIDSPVQKPAVQKPAVQKPPVQKPAVQKSPVQKSPVQSGSYQAAPARSARNR